MENIYEKMNEIGVVPVIKIDNAEDALPLAGALASACLPCAEITFRTDAAEESIKLIAKKYPDFMIAAGTVLSPETADRAIDAGASLIVAPGFNPKVVEHCLLKKYPVIPGVCTPSEIELALSYGLDKLKFFPAEAAGGVKYIKAVSAPYGMVRFMPTGGISISNLKDYLTCKAVFCCGGSWMVKSDLIKEGKFDEIEKMTAEAVKLVKEIKK